MTAPVPRFSSDDEAAQHWLMLLRDGNPDQKIQAREQLATIFERRGMLEEATELLISNIHDGVRSADIFRWLARLYRNQGQEVLAMQAAAEAAKYLDPPASQQSMQPATMVMAPVSEHRDQRDASALLDEEIARYVRAGYRVQDRSTTSAQLLRPKDFSAGWAILWFLLCGVGVLVYVFYYMGKSDSVVYLAVDEDGEVEVHLNQRRVTTANSLSGWACRKCGYTNRHQRPQCKSCRTPFEEATGRSRIRQ